MNIFNRILVITIAWFIVGDNNNNVFAAGRHARTAKIKKAQAARAARQQEVKEVKIEHQILKDDDEVLSAADILNQLKDLDLKHLPKKDIEGKDFLPRFVSDMVNAISPGYVLVDEDIELSMCSCHNITGRLKLVVSQLDRINQLHRNKSAPLVHASRNSWKLLQEYMLAYGLLLSGYKNITICCIDEGYAENNFKNLQKIFTKIATKYDAIINLLFFNSVYDYLEAIQKKEAPKSHSFSSIDPPLLERGLSQNPQLKNFTNKSAFIALESEKLSMFKLNNMVFYLLLNYGYDSATNRWNITPRFFKNSDYKAPDEKQATYDDISSELKKLETNTYENTDAIIKQIHSISSELYPLFCDSALDSQNLIEGAQAVVNPIIFEGEQTSVNSDNNVVIINEYTPETLRKKITIENLLADQKQSEEKQKKSQLEWLKNKAEECYNETLFKDFEADLKRRLKENEITLEQFEEFKALAENKSKLGDFDGWSKNITQSNNHLFMSELKKAFKDEKFDEIAYKKYAQQALKGLIKQALQKNLNLDGQLNGISGSLDSFFDELKKIDELSKISDTKIPEEAKLQTRWILLKTEAFKRYTSGLKNCDKEAIQQLRWFIREQVYGESYFTPEQAEALRTLFNNRARELGVEIILSAKEKAEEEKKLAEERAAEQKKLAEERAAEQKKRAEEKAAEQKKLAEEKLELLRKEAAQCYSESLFKSFEYKLDFELGQNNISVEQFNELKMLAENKSKLGDFDGWSKNLTLSNQNAFTQDLEEAFKSNTIDEISYKKYARQAVVGLIKLIPQVNLNIDTPVYSIGRELDQFSSILNQIDKLSHISDTKTPEPEEKKLQDLWTKFKDQAFLRYKTDLPNAETYTLPSLRWFLEKQVDDNSYFTPGQAEELRTLFNNRAREFGVETIVSAEEKAETQKKLTEAEEKFTAGVEEIQKKYLARLEEDKKKFKNEWTEIFKKKGDRKSLQEEHTKKKEAYQEAYNTQHKQAFEEELNKLAQEHKDAYIGKNKEQFESKLNQRIASALWDYKWAGYF